MVRIALWSVLTVTTEKRVEVGCNPHNCQGLQCCCVGYIPHNSQWQNSTGVGNRGEYGHPVPVRRQHWYHLHWHLSSTQRPVKTQVGLNWGLSHPLPSSGCQSPIWHFSCQQNAFLSQLMQWFGNLGKLKDERSIVWAQSHWHSEEQELCNSCWQPWCQLQSIRCYNVPQIFTSSWMKWYMYLFGFSFSPASCRSYYLYM